MMKIAIMLADSARSSNGEPEEGDPHEAHCSASRMKKLLFDKPITFG